MAYFDARHRDSRAPSLNDHLSRARSHPFRCLEGDGRFKLGVGRISSRDTGTKRLSGGMLVFRRNAGLVRDYGESFLKVERCLHG